ncbi:hypothetical protein GGI06_003542 [Coemansia sp. S85]|nr:hypothetical protein GGI06_003542 [Coemansia sp. S85]
MHLRYPTVSQDDLDAMSDTTCIICRDEMTGPSQEQADIWNNERRAGLAQNLSGDTPKRLPYFPAPDLTTLSDEQIKALESGSRAAVEERIRILSAFQVQISHMVVALTQVQSLSTVRATPTTSRQTESTLPSVGHGGASPASAVFDNAGQASTEQRQEHQAKGKELDI